ncbi:threonine--tRNA ligase [Methanomassiliicoccus luminyensis]|uniref:threonine--tRNA ligase n=1 Tax=Methanomassiliicoccus luminyensis TaxID=1080712 RepID=UPI00035CC481|nr:threonine--tRNA ligase [Methanomassiliicoccus luminyensis]
MKTLFIHADFLEFNVKKPTPVADQITDEEKHGRYDEVLVAFISVEKQDEAEPEAVAKQAVANIKDIVGKVGAQRVVLYPYAHLSSSLSSPAAGKKMLRDMEKLLMDDDIETHRAPFGWYKAFDIACKGHPLSELSRDIKVAEKKAEAIDPAALLKQISKARLSKENLKENDHRIIGQKLDLFSFYDVAPGMVFWHPKGLIIRNALIDFWREEHRKAGYQEIKTPQVMSDILWKVSGHWGHYKDNIFLTNYDDRQFAVKPMNCPGGLLVFSSRERSYRELPLRMSELGEVHRLELSGVLSGLFRVIQFTQDDAHIYCTEEQLEQEINGVIDLIDKFYKLFGFEYRMELSTKPENSMGDPALWVKAEAALRNALDDRGVKYEVNEGDGAFYGPKIDFKIKDSLGREWQTATIQLDFQMPERFQIKYVGDDGKDHTPIMLHRAIYGSLERFIGILLEHLNGNLPVWLAPIQARVIAFKDDNAKAAEDVRNKLFDQGYRVDLDVSYGTVEGKIRDAELQKIPYIIVIGDKEEQNDTLAVRRHGTKAPRYGVKFDDFEAQLREECRLKTA